MNHLECMSNPWEVESHTVVKSKCVQEKGQIETTSEAKTNQRSQRKKARMLLNLPLVQ